MAQHKTYGITGFIEYTADISVGRAHMSIHFKDGSITNYGVYPAKYTSKSPIEQAIIENSPLFKQGRITICGVTEVPDEEPVTIAVPEHVAAQQVIAEQKQEQKPAEEKSDDAIKFASLADAKEYLQKAGVDCSNIKFKADAVEIAKVNGYNIEFAR